MTENLHVVFKSIKHHPHTRLCKDVQNAVKLHRERMLRIQKRLYGTLSFISLIAIVPAIMALTHQLSQSGFYQYLSVAFSSGGAVFGAWKAFAGALAESLPGMSIALVLALLGTLVWSARNTFTLTTFYGTSK